MKEWVKMPSDWIRDKDQPLLSSMKWSGDNKADQIAALMLHIVLVHHANPELVTDRQDVGLVRLTYSELGVIVGISRAKISGGLKLLDKMNLIERLDEGKSNLFKIKGYEVISGWAKLPARGLYDKGMNYVSAFQFFHLRVKNELNALKIYFVVIAFRDNYTGTTSISYEKISAYTGVNRNEIRLALSFLVNAGLVNVESGSSDINEYSTINIYRLAHIERYKHRGTMVRPSK